ncbi:hypothetical protein JNW90_21040 [Micromonospora sp. STR1s_5]|nr:hypothetical protein [Micromonospora sp. STR1s_5]
MDHDEFRDLLAQIPPDTRVGGDPEDEAEHFFVCKACAQVVDMRDLGEVFRHAEPGHVARKPS